MDHLVGQFVEALLRYRIASPPPQQVAPPVQYFFPVRRLTEPTADGLVSWLGPLRFDGDDMFRRERHQIGVRLLSLTPRRRHEMLAVQPNAAGHRERRAAVSSSIRCSRDRQNTSRGIVDRVGESNSLGA